MADEIKEKSAQKGKDKNKAKKKKEPGKVRRWFKDFFSELKKVTWPTFGKVLKQTGTVLLVTVCFLLVVLAFDSLLGYLYHLLLGGLSVDGVTALSTLVGGGGGLL
ncbi:MAG: preprotein translocase subunit SecE [Clostridiales bacterium]|nr:preprotein translocase subunit SecE [Clostridiales bacterium]